MKRTRTNETDYRLWYAWRELRRGGAVRQLRKSILADSDGRLLDVPQVETLRMIVQDDEGMLMGEVAKKAAIEASTATRAIDKLEDRGLVERERMEDNARFIRVRATDRGREMVDRINENERRYMRMILRDMSKGEREDLVQLMERLLAGLERVFPPEGAADEQPTGRKRGKSKKTASVRST